MESNPCLQILNIVVDTAKQDIDSFLLNVSVGIAISLFIFRVIPL